MMSGQRCRLFLLRKDTPKLRLSVAPLQTSANQGCHAQTRLGVHTGGPSATGTSLAALVAILLLGGIAMAEDVERLARTYTYHAIGEVMPTPQKATYRDAYLPIFDIAAGRPLARIYLPKDASLPARIGAQEIANRVRFLADGKGTIEVAASGKPKGHWLIVSGEPLGKLAIARLMPGAAEAYSLGPLRHGKGIEAVAGSPLGLYWACQSLVQLLSVKDGKVVLREAEIEDHPVFGVRSFKVGGKHEGIEDMGRWSPSAKFNTFNVCYTTVGRDLWPNPSQEYRELVKRLCSFLLPRGTDVMLFVNPYYLWKEHIQTSDPKDLDALARTCSLALDQGARKVMLCLDDFASKHDHRQPDRLYVVMNEQDREQFGDDLAKANVALLNGWYQRMKARHPKATLLVVLPYYWLPGGSYREEGERNLREIGKGTPKDLVIVWTGPRVRSTTVDRASVDKYTGLLGRKPFLWDNTLYAWHRPPHYFLDEFKTTYPEKFWELTELGCHYNAGGGEAYKVGLWCVADWLWNPAAYDPKASLRKAIAIVAGPACVDILLEFRDLFYQVREGRIAGLGDPKSLLAEAKRAKSSPFDPDEVAELRGRIRRLPELAAQIEKQCTNAALVAEVKQRCGGGAAYLQALDLLAKLPAPSAAELGNLLANPGAERAEGGRPAGFGTYAGAGRLELAADPDAHTGQRSARFRATEWYLYPNGRKWINVALCVGGSNGYVPGDALKLQPFAKYHFRFWAKSDVPKWELSVVAWRAGKAGRSARIGVATRPAEIATTPEWRCYTGSFVTPPGIERAALKLGLTGNEKDGARLGTLWLDDAYLGRGKPR